MYTYIACYFYCFFRKFLLSEDFSFDAGLTIASFAFLCHLLLVEELIAPIWNVTFSQIVHVGGVIIMIPVVILFFLFLYILKKILEHDEYRRFNKMSMTCQPMLTLWKSLFAFALVIVPFVLTVNLFKENINKLYTTTTTKQHENLDVDEIL